MTSRWLPANPLQAASLPGSLQLFCIPYAGSGASVYRSWAGLLPSVDVSPVQLPGREDRYAEMAHTSIGDLAEEFAAVLATNVHRPYAMFGYSMGALIAYEAALCLQRAGAQMPVGIVFAAHQAPQLAQVRTTMWNLPDAEFQKELRSMGGMPEEVFKHPELLEFVLPTLRADIKACDTYSFAQEPPLDVPFAVFGGWNDIFVPPENLDKWGELTSNRCSVHRFPGGHFFIKENRELMLRTLAQCLAQWH